MDDNIKIIRRNVKHARLRVRQDSSVELIIPKDFLDDEINNLLDRKAAWIQEKHAFFQRNQRGILPLASNEVMLLGEHYRIETNENLEEAIKVDLAGRRLLVTKASDCNKSLKTCLREFAKGFLSKRVIELSEKHGLTFGRLFIRSQRTKWGNCSAKRNISLNWRLISAPERVIDYVILHELLHTKTMNHGQMFWVHLHAICPWAKEAVAWLNANQPEPDGEKP